MKKVKKSLVLLSAVVFGLAIASCGSKNDSSTNVEIPSESVGLEFELSDDKDSYNVYSIGTCRDIDVVIPASYNGLPVIGIIDYAFCGYDSLASITIPDSVASIGNGAFDECKNLRSITMSSSLTSIGARAFYGCIGLTSITIPGSVTSIGEWAFRECSSLISITIPSSLTSIGDYAFSDCNSLTSIIVDSNNNVYDSRNNCNAIIETSTNTLILGCKNTIIPSSVSSIEKYAFHVCSLTSITIPSSVISIGEWAFSCCYSLTSVTIPNSVTSIGDYAFWGCKGVTSITIPSSVTSIGADAFFYCKSLTSITFTGTKEQWNNLYKTNQGIQSGVVVTCTDGTITIE